MTDLKLKRAYEPIASDDGYRVYIDKLCPRGLSHETFRYDTWDKEISPSDELRHWFHDNPEARWTDFVRKYLNELKSNPAWTGFLQDVEGHPVVTLLYSSRDENENNAVVVADALVAASDGQIKMQRPADAA